MTHISPPERQSPALLIFDCDGVLVDSELIDARIRAECFQAEGFPVTVEDLQSHSGISGAGMAEMILERFGRQCRKASQDHARLH